MGSLSSAREDRNLHILAAKRLIGTARVDISCLNFFQGRQRDHRVVDYLSGVFLQNDCLRYDPDNFVPVLITRRDLDKALCASGLDDSDLKAPAAGLTSPSSSLSSATRASIVVSDRFNRTVVRTPSPSAMAEER